MLARWQRQRDRREMNRSAPATTCHREVSFAKGSSATTMRGVRQQPPTTSDRRSSNGNDNGARSAQHVAGEGAATAPAAGDLWRSMNARTFVLRVVGAWMNPAASLTNHRSFLGDHRRSSGDDHGWRRTSTSICACQADQCRESFRSRWLQFCRR